MSRALTVLESPLKSESIIEVNARKVDSEKFPLLRLLDPSLKWYVYPALDFRIRVYGDVTATNQTLYLCDDALCFPMRFSGYLSWYDPSANNVGSRVFPNHPEAWDHANESNNTTTAPYNGAVVWIVGYRGYFVAVHLTDGTSKVQVNIIHRYTDGAILIFNTGKDGATSVNITIRVNDPPSGLGYSVATNGTRGTGYTDIAPNQYVLFYKGTAPSVDTTNGVFATSPMGSSISLLHELYINSFTFTSLWLSAFPSGVSINVPKMYLGIKAPSNDVEVVSNGRFIKIFRNKFIGIVGLSKIRSPINISTYMQLPFYPFMPYIYANDPYASAGTHMETHAMFKVWSGWAEDDNGNVKFILFSGYAQKHTTKWEPIVGIYGVTIYDVDRDEEYTIGIAKPLKNVYNYGEVGLVPNYFMLNTYAENIQASALKYINANDAWNTVTSNATTTYEWYDDIYGYCNVYSDRIVCVEGIGIYTDDSSLAITNAKSAWGVARGHVFTDKVGGIGIRVPSWGDKTLTSGKLYLVVTRQKEFPASTSDTDLQNWFKQITPKVLTSGELNSILSILPWSLYLFGENKDTVSITAPSSVNPNSMFSVTVSCPARAGKSVWVAIVDANGNVVSSASGTLDSSGNATLSLTAPSTTGIYRIVAIVAGDRTLP